MPDKSAETGGSPAGGAFVERVLRYLDGTLPDEGVDRLGRELTEDPARRDRFVRLCLIEWLAREGLAGRKEAAPPEEAPVPTLPLRTAGTPVPAKPARTKDPVEFPRWLVAATVLLAAGSIIVFFAQQSSRPRGGTRPPASPVVATLTTQVSARWEGLAPGDEPGLTAGTSFKLAAGYAELALAGGARAIVEGPAQFTVESPTALSLASGKLLARAEGGGFIVRTPGAIVTDLGTEFGVWYETEGRTRVEVFQGRVTAAPRSPTEGAGQALVVSAGQAATVSGNAVILDPAGAVPQHFVRDLLTGAASLDATDLVCGGDGTTRRQLRGIDVLTGQAGRVAQVGRQVSDGQYHRVPSLPVVDGCFIPDGRRGPVQVDSAGHTFAFPATDGTNYSHLWAGGPMPRFEHQDRVSPLLSGVDYSQPGRGLLYILSNKGLTLDLDAVRRLHPGRAVSRFRCTVGFSDTEKRPRADVYVLVDGQSRFERRRFTGADGAFSIDVPLDPGGRFLTLATTDGGDTSDRDRVLWADPLLDLTAR